MYISYNSLIIRYLKLNCLNIFRKEELKVYPFHFGKTQNYK